MEGINLVLAFYAATGLVTMAAEAAIVQLPLTVVYSGGPPPQRLLAKLGDSNIKVIPGLDFRITSQAKANGITKSYLESQVRKAVTTYEPLTGQLTVTTPKMAIGSISAEVTIEVPQRIRFDIHSEDGNVALEGVSVEGLAIATNDGNVELVDVVNNGHASIQTFDGNVRIRGTSVGVITTKIKGDGRLWDERNTKPSGPGALEIVTKDGNVTLRK
jgi:hypothetical protein